MMRFLAFAVLLVPGSAWALDAVDANGPITCPANSETFYPRGDSWAFLAGGACKGADPATGSVLGISTGADSLADSPGHCLWVGIDEDGPTCKTECAEASVQRERARKTVFASLRTWSGLKAGDSTIGNPDWYCPTPTQNDMATPKVSRQSILDYSFLPSNTAVPTLSFFRGPNVPATETDANGRVSPNHGDTQECYTECVPSLGNCSGLTPLSPQQNPPLFKCPDTLTDLSKARFRFTKVRNNIVWVQGAGSFLGLGYSAGTLAVTETIYWPDNGVAVTSDMLINSETIDWRYGDPDVPGSPRTGCDIKATNCFDLGTVTLHEAGHFIGLGHVGCEGAVMFRSALPTTKLLDLTKHEMAGVCSLYRPSASGGRYPPASREGEGCFADLDCTGTNLKCLFSARSFYKSTTELAAAELPKRIPHRGICVVNKQCTADIDCDPKHGRVCQSFDESGIERYCLPGSPARPPASAASSTDFCTPCLDGTECRSGVCSSTSEMGITLTGTNIPASICTAKCNLASGCKEGFTCKKTVTGSSAVCVPNAPQQCVDSAAAAVVPLYETCGEDSRCASGLTCFDLFTSKVCLNKCNTERKCDAGFGCLFPVGTDAMQSAEGACFKKDMKEGDNCAIPSTVVCGLKCTGSGSSEVCAPTDARTCFYDPRLGAEYAQCYAICSDLQKCALATQKCAPLLDADKKQITDPQGHALGYCDPIAGGSCLRGTGEPCTAAADCLSGDCRDLGAGMACTATCDLKLKSGCPVGTDCIDVSGKGQCKPTGALLAGVCSGTGQKGIGCGCHAAPLTASETALLMLAALWLLQRAMLKRR